MLTTLGKRVRKGTKKEDAPISCPSLFDTVPIVVFRKSKNTAYNKARLTIHLSSPLIVLISLYI